MNYQSPASKLDNVEPSVGIGPQNRRLTPPIRDKFLSDDEFGATGERLASTAQAPLQFFQPFDFRRRERDNEKVIDACYESTAHAAKEGYPISPAAEWLLDNHHLVEENLRQVRRDLPIKFYNQLPSTAVKDAGQEVPRVLALAWTYVAHTNSAFSSHTLTAITEGFQSVKTLKIGEIWAIPAFLRFVLLENLRRASERVQLGRELRQKANDLADRMLAAETDEEAERQFTQSRCDIAEHAFSAQLLYRLRDGSERAQTVLQWLEKAFAEDGVEAEEMLIAQQNSVSSANVIVGNIISSLRAIDDMDWISWFEGLSAVDRRLRVTTDFELLDPRSRNRYRERIETLARRSNSSEMEVTDTVIEMARQGAELPDPLIVGNIGYYLVGNGIEALRDRLGYRRRPRERMRLLFSRLGWFGIALPVTLLTLSFLAVAAMAIGAIEGAAAAAILLLLLALPASEAAMGIFNMLSSYMVQPYHMPGYEYRDGIPREARTLVVVPCMIGDRDTIDELARNLEVHYLSNPLGETYFALLSDWPDADVEERSEDSELLEYAQRTIDTLAETYAHTGRRRFFLLHRRRVYEEVDDVWMGWERKRGKLEELFDVLRGETHTTYMKPAHALPDDIAFVLTLDSDTRLPRDTVTKLVGKMAHPLNAPINDPDSNRVTGGYGILQPRITPSLTTGEEASAFQRMFSSNRGLDPYVFAVSDTYQDVFREGSFTGKGLIHVDAFRQAMAERIEDNTVLSHDLLEGALARSALVTDVEFVEDFPTKYAVEVGRQHRWIRGDWQLLPFIFGSDSDITPLNRFKMIDNLRRSLLPIAWVLASIAGWVKFGVWPALVWQLVLIAVLIISPVVSLFMGFLSPPVGVTIRSHLRTYGWELLTLLGQTGLRVAFMAHTAWYAADAVGRTLYRLFVSRRQLLEWKTAAQMQKSAAGSPLAYLELMWPSSVIAAIGLMLALSYGNDSAFVALPITVAWFFAPLVAWQVSRSAETDDRFFVSQDEQRALRRIARRTWRYFETFVSEEHNHLPPDNFQEDPEAVVAARTSPTNIGLYLISTVSARDLGWIGFEEMLSRIEATLVTLRRMEKHRGHLYNWYDTKSLQPLPPRYISAVDSGNLAGHLIVVSSALKEAAAAPAAFMHADAEGIRDAATIVSEALDDIPNDRRTIRPLRARLTERLDSFVTALDRGAAITSVKATGLMTVAQEIERLALDIDLEVSSDNSRRLVFWSSALVRTCEAHFNDPGTSRETMDRLRRRLTDVSETARGLAFDMEFGFLMNKRRRLLSIGYRVDEAELDDSCYDLLASEARLTSLFAIAKGDVPNEHWFRLGRPVVPVSGRATLASWSGSMFEYLMPPLVMHERQGGLLYQTNRMVVRVQQRYARELGVPWGISESAYNARDHMLTYQYSNFGVPSLGLKRDLARNAVVAPYATMLASQVSPSDAIRNMDRLRDIGAQGAYGFYESVDFTPSRLPKGEKCAVIRSYFAHHQGMSICAAANVVTSGRLRELFHSDPVIEAAELLLQERAPRTVAPVSRSEEVMRQKRDGSALAAPAMQIYDEPTHSDRRTHLLSNGHYNVMVTATGAGYSRWNGLAITRWRPDPVEDSWGQYIFLRDAATGQWWSTTGEPRSAPNERSVAVFTDSQAEFRKRVGTISSSLDILVTTEGDGEGRRLTLSNSGSADRLIEVTSFAELVLSADQADMAHPAFSKMFVRTEIDPAGDAIIATRNKRTLGEPDIHVAHLITETAGQKRATQFETDRRAFIGRERNLASASAFDPGAELTGSSGFTLDPIMSLRRIVRIPAGKKATITFWTLAAADRETLNDRIAHYRHTETFNHESQLAWTRSQVQLRHINITSEDAETFQRLARYLIYPDMDLRIGEDAVRDGLASQSALWPLGISGDHPIFVLRTDDENDLKIVSEALAMQEYLRGRGHVFDLVILNERVTSYAQDMQQAVDILCENARHRGLSDAARSHIFAVRHDLMDQATYDALLAAARITLHTRNGRLSQQLARLGSETEDDLSVPLFAREDEKPLPTAIPQPAAVAKSGDDLLFWNGMGGFDPETGEYVVRMTGGERTPQPWINVISGKDFGFHVSAGGAAFTWSINSRDYQLTPWSNDPVLNRPGEALYVRDLESGITLTPFAALAGAASEPYEARHGMGYSAFHAAGGGLRLDATMAMADGRNAKLTRLRIQNEFDRPRRLRLYAVAEWVLGNNGSQSAPFIASDFNEESGVLSATNPYSVDFSGRYAFLALSTPVSSHTASRRNFIGGQSIRFPQAVAEGAALDNTTAIGGDPCAALTSDIDVPANGTVEVLIILGDSESAEQASEMAQALRDEGFEPQLAATKAEWDEFLGTLQVETPDPAMNLMVNHWLPYQALACRIRARSAFYQASGAYGFRDQLQDTSALLLQDPSYAQAQILNAAGRQFPEGDVQHWWLPRTGAGVRTMISDDVVWLGYLTAHYVRVTGDTGFLDSELPFIQGPALEPGAHDAFYTPEVLDETVSLYEHCARALDLGCARRGENGLPLILGGDWNDGMNRVGEEGRGTSVWLGWFMAGGLSAMIPLAEARGDQARVERWAARRDELREALQNEGWDGDWYRRGSFDDGTPLGSHRSDECRIDTIAQSWSVLSGEGNPERSGKALDKVLEILTDDEVKIIKLFTPPFQHTAKNPGYIKGYPPGVRENGGQYTHGAIWTAYALAEMGRPDDAWKAYSHLLPINHALSETDMQRYRVEPYVVAADIYGEEDRRGRGGWTWYTGSAGWLYRCSVEAILGIRRQGERLFVKPAIPSHWDGYSATLRQNGLSYRIEAERIDGRIVVRVNGLEEQSEGEGFVLN
ncbi:GH36-type glycosyl hydrolase domain-containing protein [Notoacmeibacter sp. MSK16QG-6]|uniref:GH36-type glycosyl hydrolase domain-containing protein n=1 Tax=Notoacmeibacter sp. MSK16QG-6 TaxID=2957982 RepID=UPI00209F911E|nr:glucoamylase family protein [Notoacmeibacter sp. MSK16QG-6]MCP1198690.1 DUF3131 domain-containing protein [Notoacmeibacter sp. MSK16QG-6]